MLSTHEAVARRCPACGKLLFKAHLDGGGMVYQSGGVTIRAASAVVTCRCGAVLRYNADDNQTTGLRADATAPPTG